MKALFLAAVLAQAPGAAPAQQLPRADVHVVAAWQNLHKEQPVDHYNDWLNGIFYAGAGAGWFWTDHLKTQIDAGAGTRAVQYRTESFRVGNAQAIQWSRLWVNQQSVAISQQYQFFRNQWFHPHAGAGIDIARETSREEFQPVNLYGTAVSPPIRPARTEGPVHRVIARPFGEAGFKAYMTRRTFFTGDMRVMFRGGIDEVLFRAGFGVDF